MYGNISFKSLNNPIKPFKINTEKGELEFKEVDYNNIDEKEVKETTKFFIDNFAYQSSTPLFYKCRKNSSDFDEQKYNAIINWVNDDTRKALKDSDTTLLIGRNKNNEISSAILSETLNLDELSEKDTLYIDMLAVNPQYRHAHIGGILCNKVMESSKNRHTDCMLLSYNESIPFYEQQGFTKLKISDETQKIVNKLGDLYPYEYPYYATCMTKPIQEDKTRWWTRI